MKIKTTIIPVTTVILFVVSIVADIHSQRKDNGSTPSAFYFKNMSQKRKTIDTAEIRILYAFNAPDLNDKSTWIDEGQLKITKGWTQYSSHFEEINEDSLAQWFHDHPKANGYPAFRWLQGYKNDDWIEYQYSNIHVKDGVLEEWAAMPQEIDEDNLVYSETLPLQKWKTDNGTKTICGYTCMKATCTWRGRDYTAWYSPQIPVPYGPWKFGGLPGLIIAVSDATGEYSWEAVAVNKGSFPIFAPRRKKYTRSTREKVLKLQRQLNEDYIKTTGAAVFDHKTGQPIFSRKHKYTPLELE